MEKFKTIGSNLPPIQIAILLSTSRLVGMKCPGINSLFTKLSIKFLDNSKETSFNFKILKYNRRFNLLKMHLDSDSFLGDIEAFLRPPLASKLDISKIQKIVYPNEFSRKTALVIGGSRGLGEAVAKIISVGGGKTIITYNQGIDDAKEIVSEITNLGFESCSMNLNVLDSNFELPDGKITDIFYFASPRIKSTNPNYFDEKLYEKYKLFFVDSVVKVLSQARKKYIGNISFFYPSTVFLNEKPPEFKEYIRAKREGEIACQKTLLSFPDVNLVCPRLPRLDTDQSQSLMAVKSEDPIPLLHSILRQQ